MKFGKQCGMTLIELLVVIVIIAILSAIAIPGYRQYVIRANRSSAKVALLQASQALERCFTRYNAYNTAPSTDAACTFSAANTPDNTYRITYTLGATTYTITATPQGRQASDTKCGNFTLDQANNRLETGTDTAANCWGK